MKNKWIENLFFVIVWTFFFLHIRTFIIIIISFSYHIHDYLEDFLSPFYEYLYINQSIEQINLRLYNVYTHCSFYFFSFRFSFSLIISNIDKKWTYDKRYQRFDNNKIDDDYGYNILGKRTFISTQGIMFFFINRSY